MKAIKTLALTITAFCFLAATPISTNLGASNVSHHDIVSIASGADNLSTLVKAIQAAGLVETLQSDGPFTVFAPTNEAFAALPDGTLESLLKEENRDKLVQILTYHVVPGKVMSTDLEDGMMAETVEGSSITVDLSDGVAIDNANVVSADIEADNGVVHIIDSVIMPSDDSETSSY
ncbi:MAG: fasciclin domain-containing protein [Balneolaceae bacterium]|nr:fasciclin domain-containing protein [Balneolaceae bacterium]